MNIKFLSIGIVLIFGLLQSGIAQKKTEISKSWRDPAIQIKINQFNRILVVAFIKDEVNRVKVENELVKLLKGKGFASHEYLGANQAALTEEAINARVQEAEFDGAIVLRLYDPNKPLPYMPGTGTYPAQYKNFPAFFEGAFSKFQDPENLVGANAFAVETNFYTLTAGKLIWNALTNSNDGKDFDKWVAGLSKVITDEMKKQGFLY